MVYTASLPTSSSSAIARRVRCDYSMRSACTFALFSTWAAVSDMPHCSSSSNDLSPVFKLFAPRVHCSTRCSFLLECLLYRRICFNEQFLKTNIKFYHTALLHFTCHAQGRTNSLYADRCNSRMEWQNVMKFCTHSHQTSYSVIPWLFARWRYLYYLHTFSLETFQTYCVVMIIIWLNADHSYQERS